MTQSTLRPATAERVMFLARNVAVGGAERAFVNLVNNIASLRPHVALLRHRGGLLPELDSQIPVYALDAPLAGSHITADTLEATPLGSALQLVVEMFRLAKAIDTSGCTVVSSFLMRSHLVALLVKAFLRPDIRVVLNIHEHMSQSATFLYPRRRDRWAMRLITRHLFPSADRIVVVAEALRSDLISNYGLDPSLISTMYNPVDEERIKQMALGKVDWVATEPRSDYTVCAVGRLVPLKGYDMLLRAVAIARTQLDIRVALVGDGECRQALHDLAKALGIGEHVHFAGWEGNPWRYVAQADVLALSSHTEAFPSVIAEAMVLGVPVVAMECSAGVREVVDGGRAGVLVPAGDVGALADALVRALTDADLRTTLQSSGKAFVERMSLPRTIAAYEQMLHRVSS